MAIRNSQRTSLMLNGTVNLDKNKSAIVPFNVYNEKNAPIYNGCLSPVYAKNKKIDNGEYDEDGNLWTIEGGMLLKNGVVVSENNFISPYVREEIENEILWKKNQSFVSSPEGVIITNEKVEVTKENVIFSFVKNDEEKNIILPKGENPTFRPLGVIDNEFYYCYAFILYEEQTKLKIILINATQEETIEANRNVGSNSYAFINICVPYNDNESCFKNEGLFCVSICSEQGAQLQNPVIYNFVGIVENNRLSLEGGENGYFTPNYTNAISTPGITDTHADAKKKFIFCGGALVSDSNFVYSIPQAEMFFVGNYNEKDTGKISSAAVYLYGGKKVNGLDKGEQVNSWSVKNWGSNKITDISCIWKYGDDYYYSDGYDQFKYDKNTQLWTTNSPFAGTYITGSYIWTYEGKYYLWDYKVTGGIFPRFEYAFYYKVLNPLTMTWEEVSTDLVKPVDLTAIEVPIFEGRKWYFKDNVYCQYGTSTYKLKKEFRDGAYRLSWEQVTFNIEISNYNYIWKDGEELYYSTDTAHYRLNPDTMNFEQVTAWNSTLFNGKWVWHYNDNVYAGLNYTQYAYNRNTNSWDTIEFIEGILPYGLYVWNTDESVYFSYQSSQYDRQYRLNEPRIGPITIVNTNNTNDSQRWLLDTGLTYADLENSPIAVSFTLYEGIYEQIVTVKKNEAIQTFLFSPTRGLENCGVNFTKGDSVLTMNNKSIPSYGIGKTHRQLSNDIKYNGSGTILFNQNYMSGISSDNGNLISAWFDISDVTPVFSENEIYYKDENGRKWKLEKKGNPTIKKIVANKYILINSDSELNAYNKETNKFYSWSISYNGNLKTGNDIEATTIEQLTNGSCLNIDSFSSYSGMLILGAAVNAHYEVTKNPFTGAIFAQANYFGLVTDNIKNCIFNPSSQEVEVYISEGDESTAAIYDFSFIGTNSIKRNQANQSIAGLYYPTTEILSLPFYSEIKHSYNSYDFLQIGGNGYPIIYSNNQVIFAYLSLSFVENLSSIFVIQNTAYGITGEKILRMDYEGGNVAGTSFVADVTGLKFIGSTPKYALFYSPVKRMIYSFTGDCVLSVMYDCGAISEIITTENAFFQTINFIVCLAKFEEKEGEKQKLLFISEGDMFSIVIEDLNIDEEIIKINSVVNKENSSIVFELFSDTKEFISEISFDRKNGFDCIPIKIKTGYNGSGNEELIILSCWYFRLLNYNGEEGDILKLSEKLITDQGTRIENKTVNISAAEFDEVSGYYYLRYQPTLQRGIGISLELETKYPIYEIIGEWQNDTTMLSHNNV